MKRLSLPRPPPPPPPPPPLCVLLAKSAAAAAAPARMWRQEEEEEGKGEIAGVEIPGEKRDSTKFRRKTEKKSELGALQS